MRFTLKSKEITAFLVSSIVLYVLIIIFYAWLFYRTDSIGFTISGLGKDKPDFYESIYFSANSFHTIGYGDIHPINSTGRFLVMIESFTSLFFVAIFSGFLVYLVIHRYSDIISTDNVYIRYRNGKYFLSIRLGNKGRTVIDLHSKFEAWTIVDNTRIRAFQQETELADLERILYFDIDMQEKKNIKLHEALRKTLSNGDTLHMKFSFIGNDIRTGDQVAYARYYDSSHLKFGNTFMNVYSWDIKGRMTDFQWKNFEKIELMSEKEKEEFMAHS
ncbi:MAG: potassium channel family protein [Bacteroidota bacterium]